MGALLRTALVVLKHLTPPRASRTHDMINLIISLNVPTR